MTCDLRFSVCLHDAENLGLFLLEIQGKVLAGLKEAQFSDFLAGNAAGRQVGNTAVLKFESGVGDVDSRREDRDTRRPDLSQWLLDEGQDEIEIVDHQIQNHVYVQTSGNEGPQAMTLEKERQREVLVQRRQRRVEALRVPHVQNRSGSFLGRDQAVGTLQRIGNRLFHEHMQPGPQKGRPDLGVQHRRHRQTHRVSKIDQVPVVRKSGAGVLPGYVRSPIGTAVDDRYQVRSGQLMIDTSVVASQRTDSDNGCLQW